MNSAASAVCSSFNRRAAHYDSLARLQRAMAWRLAHHVATLPLPAAPYADLGAGTGLVGRALQQQAPARASRLLQLDGSAALLERNPLTTAGQALLWNLEGGLPPVLQGAGLLVSSFSLQWLTEPERQLKTWATALMPGGWLLLAVPVAGSFPQWHAAAARAGVPCSALPLPAAETLLNTAAADLELRQGGTLTFSRRYGSGLAFLRQLRDLGAGTSPQAPLSHKQWRALLTQWEPTPWVSWRVLVLIGRRR
jgi:malonyl-CoA O-methyltransferase